MNIGKVARFLPRLTTQAPCLVACGVAKDLLPRLTDRHHDLLHGITLVVDLGT